MNEFEILQNNNPTLDRYVKDIILGSTCLAQLFIYCYFGNELSLTGEQICHRIYHSNWYVQKPMIQKYLKMAMMRSQKRFEIRGFKIIQCSLERFLRVRIVGFYLFLFLF